MLSKASFSQIKAAPTSVYYRRCNYLAISHTFLLIKMTEAFYDDLCRFHTV